MLSGIWAVPNPPLVGGGCVPLAAYPRFGGVPLAFPASDLGVPLFRSAYLSVYLSWWFFVYLAAYLCVRRGVPVAFHPFHDMAKTVSGDSKSGVGVGGRLV